MPVGSHPSSALRSSLTVWNTFIVFSFRNSGANLEISIDKTKDFLIKKVIAGPPPRGKGRPQCVAARTRCGERSPERAARMRNGPPARCGKTAGRTRRKRHGRRHGAERPPAGDLGCGTALRPDAEHEERAPARCGACGTTAGGRTDAATHRHRNAATHRHRNAATRVIKPRPPFGQRICRSAAGARRDSATVRTTIRDIFVIFGA